MYATENVLEEFYKALAEEDSQRLQKAHIPRSEVFYVRNKIEIDTGVRYPLDRVERAMFLEGMLEASDVLDPNRRREWENT